MLTHTAEYALRAMVCLAMCGDDYISAKELAKRTHAPRNYLEKVLPSLGAAALIETRRGFGGGHRLARPSTDVTLFDVVTAVATVAQTGAMQCRRARTSGALASLNRAVDAANDAATNVLKAHTLDRVARADIAGAPILESRPTARAQPKPKKRTGRAR